MTRLMSGRPNKPLAPMNRRRALYFAGLALAATAPAGAASFWDNRDLRIIQTEELNFPPALLMEGIREGQVRAVLHIDADGKLADCLVTAYTHLPLAQEVVGSLPSWKYVPTRERGEAVGSRIEVLFSLEAKGSVISLSSVDPASSPASRMLGTSLTVVLCKATELDRPLATTHVVQPRHPGSALQPIQPTGSVVLDFYIDATGRPRMPVATRATHEAFAIAAVEALMQWQYEPPTRKAAPVVVRVVQQFNFKPNTQTEKSPPAPVFSDSDLHPRRGQNMAMNPR